MKSKVLIIAAVIAASQIVGYAADKEGMPKAHTGSAELERVKGLVGTWEGKMDMGQGEEQPMVVKYELTAGGSAVIETSLLGTPMQMTSVYHDDKGKLTMTHYCMLGNQPRMKLVGTTDTSVSLSMDGTTGISDANSQHMHALKISFVDDKTIEQDWEMYQDGESAGTTTIRLTRKE